MYSWKAKHKSRRYDIREDTVLECKDRINVNIIVLTKTRTSIYRWMADHKSRFVIHEDTVLDSKDRINIGIFIVQNIHKKQ